MDLSNDDTHGTTRPRTTIEGRPSYDAPAPHTPTRLKKQRSNAGVRNRSQPYPTTSTEAGQQEQGNKARKGSLRNAVRRLFGRRSREVQPQPLQTSPPRHGYHRSEPYTTLAAQPEVLEDTARDDDLVYRTFSAPISVLPSAAVQRTRSPYAVEFPQSARLKPLNLGNPYTELRRRKTLPSVRIAEVEADATEDTAPPDDAPADPRLDDAEIGRALSTSEGEKRRSRSAGDLRQALSRDVSNRKRSDEIRYWRESFQGSVLRASGFTVPVRDPGLPDEREEEVTPMPRVEDPFTSTAGASSSSPPRGLGVGLYESDLTSPSALGSQLSQDLEDRIARLEAGLHSFRGELAQIAADRNRRTVLIGGASTSPARHRRASSGGRSASMLADTLQTDFGPSNYRYEYSDTMRPSTSPQPPRSPPTRYAEPASMPPLPARTQEPDDPFVNRPLPIRTTSASTDDVELSAGILPQNQRQPPQHTFNSLYEMLSDERSARRRLEQQMQGLKRDLADLHYQVSNVSNVASQHSSYYAAMDPTVGSSRLQALLRESEDMAPRTRRARDSHGIAIDPRVVSRFSGSESEVAGETDMETPYEVYQTPAERREPFDFSTHAMAPGARRHGEGAMF